MTASDSVGADGQDDWAAPDLGSFEWDVHADRWVWSEEMYAVHGYRPGDVVPSFDLVISHKSPADRRRAERIMSHATDPDFRFRNLHWVVDARGRRRDVLSVGSTAMRRLRDGGSRPVVRGYMLDLSDPSDLSPLSARAADRVVAPAPARQPARPEPVVESPGPRLTDRERDVLALIAEGLSNAEIAEELFLSSNTVKTYVRAAYKKIGVTRRVDATLWVLESR